MLSVREMLEKNKNDLRCVFLNKKYIRLNPYQKERFLLELFHSRNWCKIHSEDRIYLLQEFENVKSNIDKRKAYKIVEFSSDWHWDRYLFDMFTKHRTQIMGIRKNLLGQGIKQKNVDGKVIPYFISYLNLFLLDSIVHEGWHVNTKYKIAACQRDLPREHLEQILWQQSRYYIDNRTINTCIQNNKKYLYIAKPDEFYAFRYSFNYILDAFRRLEKKYGKDENMEMYLEEDIRFKSVIEEEYFNDTKKSLSYNEIYSHYLDLYIKSLFDSDKKNDYYELLNDLGSSFSLTKSILEEDKDSGKILIKNLQK